MSIIQYINNFENESNDKTFSSIEDTIIPENIKTAYGLNPLAIKLFLKSYNIKKIEEDYLNIREMVEAKLKDIDVKIKKYYLIKKYQKEYEKHKNYILKFDKSTHKIMDLINIIININYDKISLEFTPDETIFFSIYINNTIIHLELYLNPTDGDEKEIFYNIFKNKEVIINGICNINMVYNEINKVLTILNNDE